MLYFGFKIGTHILHSKFLFFVLKGAENESKHHERWNGSGYPLGINGEEIPIECRILAIVDAYDAMTSDRPYRKAVSKKEAVRELQRCAGTQFDPKLVHVFLSLLEEEKNENT